MTEFEDRVLAGPDENDLWAPGTEAPGVLKTYLRQAVTVRNRAAGRPGRRRPRTAGPGSLDLDASAFVRRALA